MKNLLLVYIAVLCTASMSGEAVTGFSSKDIPLKKVTLYSSGVAHYEHIGTVSGSGRIQLLFSTQQINDVLKSLMITDPAAQKVSINYQAGNTTAKALESLKVNPTYARSLAELLHSQRGAEIEVYTPNKITGKILSVGLMSGTSSEKTTTNAVEQLTLLSEGKVHLLSFSDIQSFRFTDEDRNADLQTALNLILSSTSENRKQLTVNIEGNKNRTIELSYVMEAPVWKANYRLDVVKNTAALQAWAIVDNSTDLDWYNVILTLTTGRPVAFRQNLYEPYYTYRPELPLLAAQAAEPETFDSGYVYENKAEVAESRAVTRKELLKSSEQAAVPFSMQADAVDTSYFDNSIESNDSAGELCAFTPVLPVNLERQKSTMIPLVLASIPAEKVSVFSSFKNGITVYPKLCINIHNTSGYKLPAGPVTVFNNGMYEGDAVLEFLPENEKRFIAYGEDMEVRGTVASKSVQDIESVKIGSGTITVFSKRINETQYTVKNQSGTTRSIVIEHPIQHDFKLITEKNLTEKTAQNYRFKFETGAGSEETLLVQQEKILQHTQKLLHSNDDFFVSLASNAQLPPEAKKIFDAILKERQKLQQLRVKLTDLQNEQTKRIAEQERTRKNLEAFGKDTQQGQEFIIKLLTLETVLDELSKKIDSAEHALQTAETEFSTYLNTIRL